MNLVQIILGILAFAVVTAILYVWGLRRSATCEADLERILLSRGAGKVLRYLKKHDAIDRSEIARQVTGLHAGLAWSRRKIAVDNPKVFAQKLADFMTEQRLLEKLPNGSYRRRP